MLSLPMENWDAVADRIAATEGPIAWAWAAIPERDSWQLILLTVRGATPTGDRLDVYPNIVLSSEELSPEEAAVRFRSGTTGSRYSIPFTFGPVSGQTTTYWLTSEYIGAPLRGDAWPRYSADFSIQTNGSPNPPGRWDPLTAAGQRFHADLMSGVAEVVYGVSPSVLGNDLSANVRVTLPDRRARLGPVTFEDGQTVVVIEEGRAGSAAGLVLRAAWRNEPADVAWERQDIAIEAAGAYGVLTGGIPAYMSLAIVEASGCALDTHGWNPDRGSRPTDQRIPSEQIERWLTEGEHQTLEFKRDLDTDGVRKSFAEVVCAFANGAGGTILVGIDDDRTVVGYERPGSVADQIQNIVQDRVTERVTVGIDRIEVRGKAVYVVNVPATPLESKPHMVGTDTWLRAGGTTHRATPAELRRLLTPPSRPSGAAFYG